jgi:hypothetical protein
MINVRPLANVCCCTVAGDLGSVGNVVLAAGAARQAMPSASATARTTGDCGEKMGFIECTRHQKVANVLVLQKKTCCQSGNSARNTPATGGDTPRAHRHATSANG